MCVIRIADEKGSPADIGLMLIVKGKQQYSTHPDPKIDIAVVVLPSTELKNYTLGYFNVDHETVCSTEYINQGGGEGSNIFMPGFPFGLIDNETIMPICRSGSIARITEGEIKTTKNILLDVQFFPGSSGSPIITKPEYLPYAENKTYDKCKLLGIMHSYLTYNDALTSEQSHKIVETRTENSGIAQGNPFEYIQETIQIELDRIKDLIDE